MQSPVLISRRVLCYLPTPAGQTLPSVLIHSTPHKPPGIVVQTPYAMCGTDLGYGATSRTFVVLLGLLLWVDMPACGAMRLRGCYAVPGTDVAHGATRGISWAIPGTEVVCMVLPEECSSFYKDNYPGTEPCYLPTRTLRHTRY
eukprot:3343038-Rhodomonas_salina.2